MSNLNSIWMYWHQGFKKAPFLVKSCVKKWQQLHPDWDIHLLDKNNINDYIEPLPIKKNTLNNMSLAHQSDLIRTKLLYKYGGVWADPTCFPLKKLDDWLFDQMQAGFFLFYKPGTDRIIANWFIAAEKDCKILKDLYQTLIKYWDDNHFKNTGNPFHPQVVQINRLLSKNLFLPLLWFSWLFTKILRLTPYMIYHYAFYKLLTENKFHQSSFKKMPKISALKILCIDKFNYKKDLDQHTKSIVDDKELPLVKLDWKKAFEPIPKNSNLDYVLSN